jgi:cytosine/adenosine deaminase-related metal-dependent hydrolase
MDESGYATEDTALHQGMWETGEESLQQALEMIDSWHGKGDGRLQAWFSPRSVGGVTVELFRRISELAEELNVGVTTHWAEIQNNVDYTVEKYGMLPAEFADHVGMLGENVTLAHGICFEDHELDLLAKTGTNICHCPVCNMKLAMGAAKVPAMLEKGVNVCLGNDGMIDNNTADLFREMRTALLLQRNAHQDPIYPTAAEALEMATIRGAKAIMAEEQVGSLEPGKRADMILINVQQPHIQPLHDPLSAVVWSANGSDVETVIIDGKIVMEERIVKTMDEDRILKEVIEKKAKFVEQAKVQPQILWKSI